MNKSKFNDNFDRLVGRYIQPCLKEYGIGLKKIDSGVYEAEGHPCVLRVRQGTGHMPGLLVTLVEECNVSPIVGEIGKEVGLGVIAALNGASKLPSEVGYDEVDSMFDLCACYVREYAIPYLTNKKSDLSEVRNYIEQNIAKKGIRHKKYMFPRNVREEWIVDKEM